MLKIKLVRTGKRNAPTYRVAVQESKAKLGGLNVCEIGYIIPKVSGKHEVRLDKDAFNKWVSQGAKATKSVTEVFEGRYSYIKYSQKKAEENKDVTETPKDDKLPIAKDGEN